ncbi:MAG: 2-oxo-4-hydroxy-4-carboxy-5-ureidoimidazoline decarboxylase [Jatrophihabitans sp.]|uniref:2-oxo-4-hydroxy-4-carboxy-5-ureidoimidazoline decarboxylase n=1 Tax=Jatrophihabitans sp. TaxID=1932789 RepID=UPI00390FADA7
MLDSFNSAADDEQLRASLRACCAAEAWVERIIAGRPYPSETALAETSDGATAALDDTGLAQALAGHPRIGARVDGREGTWSRQEQSGVADAGQDVRAQLVAANVAYEQRFGHVYLVCATGRSAEELLAVCRDRLENDAAAERDVVVTELAKINRLRLAKLLHPEGTP